MGTKKLSHRTQRTQVIRQSNDPNPLLTVAGSHCSVTFSLTFGAYGVFPQHFLRFKRLNPRKRPGLENFTTFHFRIQFTGTTWQHWLVRARTWLTQTVLYKRLATALHHSFSLVWNWLSAAVPAPHCPPSNYHCHKKLLRLGGGKLSPWVWDGATFDTGPIRPRLMVSKDIDFYFSPTDVFFWRCEQL